MTDMNREMMKEEAVARMELLGLLPQTIEDFKKGRINKSEYGKGILYWLSKEEQEAVRKIEEKNNIVIYHAILDNSEFGPMYSYLYVNSYPQEWKQDREDILEGYPLAYVVNGEIAEFGTIGVEPMFGGLKRTA